MGFQLPVDKVSLINLLLFVRSCNYVLRCPVTSRLPELCCLAPRLRSWKCTPVIDLLVCFCFYWSALNSGEFVGSSAVSHMFSLIFIGSLLERADFKSF